jgi:pimeloyl-ACP methyl ester carboxylesterase
MTDEISTRTARAGSRRSFLLAAAGATIALSIDGVAEASQPSQLPPATDALTPFKVDVPQSAIDNLKSRLKLTRWPEDENGAPWEQGVPLAKAKALVSYWQTKYDWRRFEKGINQYPQFRTEIDGLGIHFLHIRSKHENALPMLMSHGWPGSVVEFMKVIDPLTNPTAHGGTEADAFHLVIPSLPGYGWSDKPSKAGWTIIQTAKAWGELMQRLGYNKRWVAQGGDWGAAVTHVLGHLKPEGLVAAHVNWQFVYPDKVPENPSPEARAALDVIKKFEDDGYGYFHLEATRPQTIGYALADSPVGQATWIYEKFQEWTDSNGDPETVLTMDEMLDDISLYWFTDTAASSGRIYWENAHHGAVWNAGTIDLPMAASVFPKEIWRAPKEWAQAHWPNLFYWNELDKGGHFAAFEQPELFTGEMRKAFRTMRA